MLQLDRLSLRNESFNELETLYRMKMVYRNLVELDYGSAMDEFALKRVANRCFSETSKTEYASKAAKRSIKLENGDQIEGFTTFFWGFVHFKIKSLQQLERMGGSSRHRDLNKPRDGNHHDQQRRDYQSRDVASRNRDFGSKIDQEASKSMLNFN